MTDRELMQQALEALVAEAMPVDKYEDAITALRERLAQPEQEPVAWQWLTTAHFRKKLPKDAESGAWNPLYTTPPQRKPLTDEEIAKAWAQSKGDILMRLKPFARAIEAAHGIKGEE